MRTNTLATLSAAVAFTGIVAATQAQPQERDILSDIKSAGEQFTSQASVAVASVTSAGSVAKSSISSKVNDAVTSASSRFTSVQPSSTTFPGAGVRNMHPGAVEGSVMALMAVAGMAIL